MPVTYVNRIYYRENQYKRGYRGDELTWDIPNYFYFENISGSNNTLTLTRNNSNGQCPVVTLEYSTDGVNWQEWQAVNDVRTYTISANGKFYLRGNNTAFGQNANGYDYHQFASTGNIEAHGSIMTLLDKTGASDTITSTGCFRSLFRNMTTLKTAPELPATNLNNAAYIYTFQNTGITEAPDLPATRIGNGYYYGMFSQCASLTKAAKMTINEFISGHINDCREMYSGCSNLTDISGITINATNIPNLCFTNTFYQCSSLTKAVPMTVNILSRDSFNSTYEGCTALDDITGFVINATEYFETTFRRTFYNCTSLTKALPMTIATLSGLGTFNSTYEGCSSLSDISGIHITATTANSGSFKIMFKGTAITESPDLSSVTTLYGIGDQSNGSFAYMFQNCANLKKITVGFSSWNSAYTYQWVNGVSSTGDFYNLGGATISSGNNGRPSGWTEHKGTIKIKWYDDNQMKYTLPSEWDSSNNGKVVGIAVQDNDRNISYTVAAKWARLDTPDTGGVNGQAMVYGDNTVSVSGVTTTTTYSTAISDYNGKANTTALLANATAQPNWRTDSTITSSYAAGYQPAACCCWRFHTLGTNQGDWYLPAAGELNSSYEFRTPINNALLTCSSPILWDEDGTTNRRWSSTQYSSSKAWHFESGQMINWNKTRDIRVRPFGDY